MLSIFAWRSKKVQLKSEWGLVYNLRQINNYTHDYYGTAPKPRFNI